MSTAQLPGRRCFEQQQKRRQGRGAQHSSPQTNTCSNSSIMAFWSQGSSSSISLASQHNRPAAGPARPLTYLLSAGPGSLVEHGLLVRLRVDVPAAAAALVAACEETDDEAVAAQQAQDAACAVGQLHQVIRGIEQCSEDARLSAVLELLQDKTLQLLCCKAVVAKVYKSLLPHKAAVGFTLAAVKECLSQKPVASWDLQEALQTAILKTLTGCSSGTTSSSSTTAPTTDTVLGSKTPTSPAAAAAAASTGWMSLSRHKLVGANLLAAAPGQVSTAPVVELESKLDASSKGLLLIIHAAGTVKFRPFSPMQALQQDLKSLRAPLTPADTDADLFTDSSKMAAAARQLDGRAVKLLPDERLVFIKGLSTAPTDPQQLQHLEQLWLGSYGLQLPSSFPFMLGVATHPEAEAAQMQVPSCCVLTNLGLSAVPGSHAAAVSHLMSDLQAAAAHYTFWGHKLTVQLKDTGQPGVAGLTQSTLQLTQQGQAATASAAGAAGGAAQLKAYSLQLAWTSAAELSQLQGKAKQQAAAAGAGGIDKQAAAGAAAAKAGAQGPQVGVQALTAAGAQLMGLVEAEDDARCCDTNATQQIGSRQQQRAGASSSSTMDKQRWQQLKTFLSEREAQQLQQGSSGMLANTSNTSRVPAAGAAAAAPPRVPLTSARALGGSSNSNGSTAAAAAPARGAAGPPAAPMFGSRRPGASKPPPASKAAGAATKKPAGTGSVLAAALAAQAAASTAAAAAAGSLPPGPAAAAAGGAAKAQPALGKRPAGAAAAAKPPAAKKPKAAAAASTAAAGAGKPKAAKKTATLAAAGAAAPAAAAGAPAASVAGADSNAAAGALAEGAAPQPAAPEAAAAASATEQQQRKRTKATDLDLAAVTAKVQAAFAASAGAALKGVTVPEMQCYLRSQGVKGGSAKRADVEAKLLALLAGGANGSG